MFELGIKSFLFREWGNKGRREGAFLAFVSKEEGKGHWTKIMATASGVRLKDDAAWKKEGGGARNSHAFMGETLKTKKKKEELLHVVSAILPCKNSKNAQKGGKEFLCLKVAWV